jgi:hypothetical protein
MAFGEKNYVVKENDHELDWQEKKSITKPQIRFPTKGK